MERFHLFDYSNCDSDYSWDETTFKDEIENIDMDYHTAANLGELRTIMRLRERVPEASLDDQNALCWTPLMYASYQGHKHVVEYLIMQGANLNKTNDFGCSALLLACLNDNSPVMELLLKAGADVNVVNNSGWSCILHATCRGNINSIKVLLDYGADPNQMVPETGLTCQMIAAMKGFHNVFRLFSRSCSQGLSHEKLSDTTYPLVLQPGYGGRSRITFQCNRFSTPSVYSDLKSPRIKNRRFRGFDKKSHTFDELLHKVQSSKGGKRSRSQSRRTVHRGSKQNSSCRSVSIKTEKKAKLKGYSIDQFRPIFQHHNVENHIKFLEDEDIDLIVFLNMTEEEFQGLGIKFGPTKKLQMVKQDIWNVLSNFSNEVT